MTGFTERTVHRALGASGRIQPRIAPITAPDPWVTPGASELGLEVYEEIEARRESGVRRVDEPRGRPEVPPESAPPRRAVLEAASVVDAVAPAPEQPAMRQVVAPPAVPSFRARTLDTASMLALAEPPMAPQAPRVPRVEGLEADVTVEVPGAPRGAEVGAAARSDVTPALRPASRRGHATEVLATTPVPGMRASEPREVRAATRGLDEAPWAAPMALLEPAMSVRRREAEASGPVVRIEIGKVELRAPSPPAPEPAPAAIAKPATFVSLEQYLQKRGAP